MTRLNPGSFSGLPKTLQSCLLVQVAVFIVILFKVSLSISVCNILQSAVQTCLCRLERRCIAGTTGANRGEDKQLRKEGNYNHSILNYLRHLAIVHIYFMIMAD